MAREVNVAAGQRRPPGGMWHLGWVCLWEAAGRAASGKHRRSWHVLAV